MSTSLCGIAGADRAGVPRIARNGGIGGKRPHGPGPARAVTRGDRRNGRPAGAAGELE